MLSIYQARDILARLRQGPATSDELRRIAPNIMAPLAELRAAGHLVLAHRIGGCRYSYELRKRSMLTAA